MCLSFAGRARGRNSIEAVNDALGIDLPEGEEFETIAEVVYNRAGRLVKECKTFTYPAITAIRHFRTASKTSCSRWQIRPGYRNTTGLQLQGILELAADADRHQPVNGTVEAPEHVVTFSLWPATTTSPPTNLPTGRVGGTLIRSRTGLA